MKVLECPVCSTQDIIVSAAVVWNSVTDKWEVAETYEDEELWCGRCQDYRTPEFREI